MRSRHTALAVCAAGAAAFGAPALRPAGAQAVPPPFVGTPQTFAVQGCALTPPVPPAFCASGTVTVGAVANFSAPQNLIDLVVERQPGFAPAAAISGVLLRYTFESTRSNGVVTTSSERLYSFPRDAVGPTRFVDAPFLDIVAADARPGSFQLTGGFLFLNYTPSDDLGTQSLAVQLGVVPEPSTLALAAAGLAAVGAAAARRKRRPA
jgi:hypothetical protein